MVQNQFSLESVTVHTRHTHSLIIVQIVLVGWRRQDINSAPGEYRQRPIRLIVKNQIIILTLRKSNRSIIPIFFLFYSLWSFLQNTNETKCTLVVGFFYHWLPYDCIFCRKILSQKNNLNYKWLHLEMLSF